MYRVLSLCAAAAAAALLASPAAAGTVLFQGLGSFLTTASSNGYVAPGDSFTFSFDLDQDAATAAWAATGTGLGSYKTAVENFVYAIDGVTQNVTLSDVEFDTDGLDLIFSDKAELEFRDGANLGRSGMLISPTWSNYSVFYLAPPPKIVPSFRRSAAVSTPAMVGNAMIVTSGPQAAVPEPAAWALMISGFGLAGAALRRRRQLSLA